MEIQHQTQNDAQSGSSFWKWFWTNKSEEWQAFHLSLLPYLTQDTLESNAYCVILPATSTLKKKKTYKYRRLWFQCDGIVLSERKTEEERRALLLSSTTLALSPAWLGKQDCESGCHGGEEENREKYRRGKRLALWRCIALVTWCLHSECSVL